MKKYMKKVRKYYNLFCCFGVLKIFKLLKNALTHEFQTFKYEEEIRKKITYGYNIIIN